MNIYNYIAYNSKNKGISLVKRYGMREPKTPNELSRMLAFIVKTHKVKGLKELAKIHPDRQLLENSFKDGLNYSNLITENNKEILSGQELKKIIKEETQRLSKPKEKEIVLREDTNKQNKSTELLIIGAIMIVGLALIMKK